MHVPHDSRPEGERTKHGNTICYCELQPSRTSTSSEGSHGGLHRKRLMEKCWRSVGNLHNGTARKRSSPEFPETGYQKENAKKN